MYFLPSRAKNVKIYYSSQLWPLRWPLEVKNRLFRKMNSCIGSRRSKTYDKGYLGPSRAISNIKLLLGSKWHIFTQYTSLKMENYNCHTKSCIPTFSNLRQYLKRDILCFEMLFTLSFKDSNFLKGSLLQFTFHQQMFYIEFKG